MTPTCTGEVLYYILVSLARLLPASHTVMPGRQCEPGPHSGSAHVTAENLRHPPPIAKLLSAHRGICSSFL